MGNWTPRVIKNDLKETPTRDNRFTITTDNSNIRTMYSTKIIHKRLMISNTNTNILCIRTFSKGQVYTHETIELTIGDDVFIATKKLGYITFAHYKIISLSKKDNCILVYFKEHFFSDKHITVPKRSYKSFIEEFITRYNS